MPSVVRLATLGELQHAHPAVDGLGMLLVRLEALRILGAICERRNGDRPSRTVALLRDHVAAFRT